MHLTAENVPVDRRIKDANQELREREKKKWDIKAFHHEYLTNERESFLVRKHIIRHLSTITI